MRRLIFLFILMLSGCAVVPEPIQVADDSKLVAYESVVSAQSDAIGSVARWGGIIAGVENKKDYSEVEVVQFRLNHYGKPVMSDESGGRFKVQIEGFLDPVVFNVGRPITFTGTVREPLEGMVGERPYIYPALTGQSYHLWRKERVYDVTGFDMGLNAGWGWGGMGFNPWFGNRFWGPFNRGFWGPPGITRSRVRVVERAPSASAQNTKIIGAGIKQTEVDESNNKKH